MHLSKLMNLHKNKNKCTQTDLKWEPHFDNFQPAHTTAWQDNHPNLHFPFNPGCHCTSRIQRASGGRIFKINGNQTNRATQKDDLCGAESTFHYTETQSMLTTLVQQAGKDTNRVLTSTAMYKKNCTSRSNYEHYISFHAANSARWSASYFNTHYTNHITKLLYIFWTRAPLVPR